jgi:hypothetical protein
MFYSFGHGSNITNVRFSHDKKCIISTGGESKSIFQWKIVQDENKSEIKYTKEETTDLYESKID